MRSCQYQSNAQLPALPSLVLKVLISQPSIMPGKNVNKRITLVARIGFVTTAMNVFEYESATLSVAVLEKIVLGRNVVVRFPHDGTAISALSIVQK